MCILHALRLCPMYLRLLAIANTLAFKQAGREPQKQNEVSLWRWQTSRNTPMPWRFTRRPPQKYIPGQRCTINIAAFDLFQKLGFFKRTNYILAANATQVQKIYLECFILVYRHSLHSSWFGTAVDTISLKNKTTKTSNIKWKFSNSLLHWL